jgi:mannose-6-phosphate isomerase-like protein (cupin superfamily)
LWVAQFHFFTSLQKAEKGDLMNVTLETRRFAEPDELLDMKDRGGVAIVKMQTGATGMHAVFEPGWTWEKDEKPLLGNPDSCPMHHIGYCISGTLVVRMLQDGTSTRITPGSFFEIPAGHDAYVDGSDRVELILFAPPEHQH